MKKYIFLLAITLLATYQKRVEIRHFFFPPPDYAAAHNVDVVLYATSWCGYCAKTRNLLNKHRIPYYEYDVENSSEGLAQYNDLGGQGVPLLQISGKIVEGYNPSRILGLAKVDRDES